MPCPTLSDAEQIIDYRPGLRLYVYRPLRGESIEQPVVVAFHGGGWQGGTPEQFAPQCAWLAGRGAVAITVQYTLATRGDPATRSICIADARAAMRFVRGRADELRIDPHRIVAMGGSAGGHLALCTACLDDFDHDDDETGVSCRPAAVVAFNPVGDTGPTGFGYVESLGAANDRWSPLAHVGPGLPPLLVLHGTDDTTVPHANAEALVRAWTDHGNLGELVSYPGKRHAFFNWRPSQDEPPAMFVDTMTRVGGFLRQHGCLPE